MLKIRLSQIGKPGQRSYRIRVIEGWRKRDSKKYCADLGYWNPNSKKYSLDEAEYKKWLNLGAQPTEPVKELLKNFS